jgi:hypothetical protein
MKITGARIRFINILLVLFVAVSSAANGGVSGHAKPPKGFSWKRFEGIRALLLVPRGWHVKMEKKNQNESFIFITRDKMEKEGGFSTGLSLNTIRNVPSVFGVLPSEYATALLIDKMQGDRESKDVGPAPEDRRFKGYKGFFRFGSEQTGKTVQYVIALGNDATGTLYVFTFESPEAEWEEAWKTGAVILNNLVLDDKY